MMSFGNLPPPWTTHATTMIHVCHQAATPLLQIPTILPPCWGRFTFDIQDSFQTNGSHVGATRFVLQSSHHMDCVFGFQGSKKGDGSSSLNLTPSLPVKVRLPRVDKLEDKLEEGDELQCDPSAYTSLHAFHIGWPDLRSSGHNQQQRRPHSLRSTIPSTFTSPHQTLSFSRQTNRFLYLHADRSASQVQTPIDTVLDKSLASPFKTPINWRSIERRRSERRSAQWLGWRGLCGIAAEGGPQAEGGCGTATGGGQMGLRS
ncbi:hypothetical protein U1Q18_018047 [Sarracenia purpurea var. burkii]